MFNNKKQVQNKLKRNIFEEIRLIYGIPTPLYLLIA